MKKLSKAMICTALLAVTALTIGCPSASTVATDTHNVIGGILQVVNAELQAGTLPAQDVAAIQGFYNLGMSLNGQLGSCITGAQSGGGKKAAFLACFNAFTNGLLSPTELASLRVVSSGSQNKVILWATGIALDVNVALNYFGGTPTATPVSIGAGSAPSPANLEALRTRVEALGIATR